MAVELLEGRVVPAAPLVSYVTSGTSNTKITGIVYDDVNANGVKDGGDNALRGWTVYLDLDNSGTLNADAVGTPEPSAVTDVDGKFSISHLMPGTYRIAEVAQAGWTPTSPVSQDVVVTAAHSTTANFFNFSGGNIVGTVWNDLDHNGIRATDPTTGAFTDPGLAGWTVFLDANNNRAVDAGEPATHTDANGEYSFVNIPAADYEVTELVPAGWTVELDNRQTVTVNARATSHQNFGNYSLTNGSIQGTIFDDANIDSVRNTDPATGAYTEPGLADWTVFLDLNNNGAADVGEPSTITDANGNYSFVSIAAGDYEVTEVLPSDWNVSPLSNIKQTVTVSPGGVAVAQDFANFSVTNGSIQGTVWNDLNRNGVRDATLAGAFTDPGLVGWNVFLDLNRNRVADPGEPTAVTDANGSYTFVNLQVGSYEVRETLPTGWEVTPTYSDAVPVTVYSGSQSIAPDFANFNIATATAGSVAGTVWNDLNGNGIRDAADPGLSGWTVFVDLNANGILDTAEPSAVSAANGSYTISGVMPGSVTIVQVAKPGWMATSPPSSSYSYSLRNAENASGFDFGNYARQDSIIRGTVYADTNANQVRDAGEKGLAGITVYLDLNANGSLDAGEPQMATMADQFFTPAVDESGTYSFTHLAAGTYTVRSILPATLSGTPTSELAHAVTIAVAEDHAGVDCAAVYRANEIHGVKFDDANGNHQQDAGETGVGGVTVYVDLNRNNSEEPGEPTTVTQADGSYSFTGMTPGAYVIREVVPSGREATYPTTLGGILWPQGVSNPAVGNVSPTSITTSLAIGASEHHTISITLPNTGALTNMVDVFLLFDDTGSFVNNSPIVRAAFPDIIAQLQASLPGINLGFGVGRFEEYANFAYEYATGRPFILNQPIVAASTPGYMTAIQAALDRTTPGYGGDQPETDIEALYQLVTGLGFDGNNNGSVLDSGAAGLVSTQLNPGNSGDVPSFASFTADASGTVMPAAGNVGGGGFRAGALPIILTATDTGFAYQPKGETSITGVGGVTLPLSALTQTSRPTTPYNYGAGIQQTVTALNALGAMVIGLGTNTEATLDPRQGLESLSTLTGAVNHSATTIANGTANPIAPGDPLYFQIASGFSASVAGGVVNAIQNAVTNVAVDITIQASDPRVKIINHSGVRSGIGSGQTATFDVEFVGDGIPHRFDLQFVRNGTNVILGSIPVVIGTPIAGDSYDFEDLPEGVIQTSVNFGSRVLAAAPTLAVVSNVAAFVGPTSGGNTVIITGANFTGVTGVTFGAANAINYTVNSTTQITAVAAAGISSTVNVAVTNAAGTSDTTLAGSAYTYAAPAITSVVINGGAIVARDTFGLAPNLSNQNSVVEQILVTFNQPVTLDADAFNISNLAASVNASGAVASNANVSVLAAGVTGAGDSLAGYTQYVLTFAPGAGVNSFNNAAPGNAFTTLSDGFFQLNTIGSRVHAGVSDAALDRADPFWSLYGAVNANDIKVAGIPGGGDDTLLVDGLALNDVYQTFGSSADSSAGLPSYHTPFDWNLDGHVDGVDLSHLYFNFGAIWTF